MEIILLQDVDKLGDKHDILTVKNGYGRNFLIPTGMAMVANSTNRRKLGDIIKKDEARENKMLEQFRDILVATEGKKLTIGAKAGTSGKIFGSVTNVQIASALKEQLNIEIPRKKIVLDVEVKELGEYAASLELHKLVTGKIAFEVVAE